MGIHCWHRTQTSNPAISLNTFTSFEIFTYEAATHSSSHSHHVQLTAATAPVLLPPLPPLRGGVGVHPDAARRSQKNHNNQSNAWPLVPNSQKLAKDGWNKWITNNLTGWFGGPMYNIRIPCPTKRQSLVGCWDFLGMWSTLVESVNHHLQQSLPAD